MGYLQALNLLIKTYKAARGVMPKGLDMLKLKMKARQKVIDAKKVIQFPKERITDWTKTRPQGLARYEGGGEGIKRMLEKGLIKIGKVTKRKKVKEPVDSKLIQEERIKEIMKQNKASAKRLQEKMNKPEKSLGEKLKDYKGDPDAMKDGGKVKRRKKGEPADQVIEEETQTEYFLDKMPRPKRSDGIISLAVGGMTNIGDTYDNNPTLQAQYPNKQDYLDLFSSQTTTTTPEVAAIPETTVSTIAPINPIKPIIPLPQDSNDDDGGGGILNNIGRTNMNQPNAMGGKEPGIVAALQRTLGDVKTAGKEIYSILSPMQMAKKTMDSINNMRAKKAAEIIEQIRREEEARLQAQLNRPRVPGGTIDSGNQGSGGYGGTGGEGPSAVGSSGMLGGGV